jgi:serine/threonine protein kinase/Leucine-rich repeat (LRR) protein
MPALPPVVGDPVKPVSENGLRDSATASSGQMESRATCKMAKEPARPRGQEPMNSSDPTQPNAKTLPGTDSTHRDIETPCEDVTIDDGTMAARGFHEPMPTGPASIDEFRNAIEASRLLTSGAIDAFLAELGEGNRPQDVESFSSRLMEAGLLTPYQAEVLRKGQSRGLVLGNYVVESKLGEGGMGMVFKARHRRMKRDVALKVLPPAMTQSKDALARFHREVEAAAKLTHVNIAAAYDADEADGIHFLVMEFVDGPNLSSYIKRVGPLEPALALQIIEQSARGLAHAHRQGVVHRDIKPGNLLIDQQGIVKILDMGLARLSDGVEEHSGTTAELTQSGRVMGTVDYMAPEQALDAKRVDHRADIYSLGCTLYFLLTGKPLSPEATLTKKLLWHQNSPPPHLEEVCQGIPQSVDDLFRMMVAKSPEDRQESMDAVMEQCTACLSEMSTAGLELPVLGIEVHRSAPSTDRIPMGATIAQKETRADVRDLVGNELAGEVEKGSRSILAITLLVVALCAIAAAAVAIWGPDRGNDLTTDVTDPKGGTSPIGVDDGGPEDVDVSPTKSVPHEKLLNWVFDNRGAVTVVSAKGDAPVEVGKIEDVPKESFDIRSVNLSGTGVSDDDLYALNDVPNLQDLSLARTRVTDDGLVHVRQLEGLWSLDLANTQISNEGLSHIERLTQLRDLNLTKTKVTDQGMARLAPLTELTKLYLSDTAIGDSGLKQLERLSGLKYLALNGTFVGDVGYDGFREQLPQVEIMWDGRDTERSAAHKLLDKGARLTLVTKSGDARGEVEKKTDLPRERFQLVAVDLSANPNVGDDDLKVLAGLTNVDDLKLSGTAITTAGLRHLHGLTSLKSIDLGSLHLDKSSVDALENALPGCVVHRKPSADRETAIWVLSQNGRVTISTSDGDETSEIRDIGQLPKGRFALREVYLDEAASVGDADIKRFEDVSGIESLFLSQANVTDAGLEHLAGCTSLRDLSLSRTKITSKGMERLGKLPSLRQLYLADTEIDGDGLKSLIALSNLTHLAIGNTGVGDGDLALLKNLPELSWLSLSGPNITDAALPQLAKLTDLKDLAIDGTAITDAGVLELLEAMPNVAISHDPFDPQRQACRWFLMTGGVVELAEGEIKSPKDLPRDAVRVLAVDLAEIEDVDHIKLGRVLEVCPDLESINLSDTNVNDDALVGLAKASKLKALYLTNTSVTDEGLARLAEATQLQLLDLRGTRITGSGFAALTNLKDLRQLLLGHTRVDDRALAALSPFEKLAALDLGYCTTISDRGAASLGDLKGLQVLVLRNTRVGDEAVKEIAKAPELTVLDLSGTYAGDDGVASLKDAAKLVQLTLAKTKVTDAAMTTLAELKGLRKLDLARTDISEEAVAKFKEAAPECLVVEPSRAPKASGEGFDGIEGAVGPGGGLFPR